MKERTFLGEGSAVHKKTVFVLGAGASRGSSFVENASRPLPPLDNDFFQQLTYATGQFRDESIEYRAKELLDFTTDIWGSNIDISMERFFSEADYTREYHQEFDIGSTGTRYESRYEDALDNFHRVLPHLLRLSANERCEFHSFIAELLNSGRVDADDEDVIISFNYDCIMDRALREEALDDWNPKVGYGFPIHEGARYWMDHKLFAHTDSGEPDNSIKLLKPHGSMNWNVSSAYTGHTPNNKDHKKYRYASLIDDITQIDNLKESIIPPTILKEVDEDPYKSVWTQARKAIRKARILVVVGYSVPMTDFLSKALFKVESGVKDDIKKLPYFDLIVLVNPAQQARRGFIDLIDEGVRSDTQIVQLNTLEELHKEIRNYHEYD